LYNLYFITLINSVIKATATYFLTIFKLDPWQVKKFNTLRRSFLWAPEEDKVLEKEMPRELEENLCTNQVWRAGHQRHGSL
jgi:hypothetical protein